MAAQTQLSFLYHTRTILHRPRPWLHVNALQRWFSSELPSSHAEANTQQSQPLKQEPWSRPKIRFHASGNRSSISNNDNRVVARSTITPSERKAFEAILRSSRPPEIVQSQSPFVDATDIDVERILNLFGTSTKSHHDISHISKSPPEPFSHDDSEPSSATTAEPHERDDPVIMAIVHRRMHEIADVLQRAAASTHEPGDIALWQACEAQIFSLGEHFHQPAVYQVPKFLGPSKFTFTAKHSDVPVEILEKEQKRHRAEFEAKEIDQSSNHINAMPPPSTSNCDIGQEQVLDSRQARTVLHRLYPAVLLFALRLFTKNFPSSHFAFNLLPRIRELGHTSYVLGASTQFYNSLMSLKWQRNSSLRDVHQLLSEMEQSGVEFNEETGRVIRHIVHERAADMSATRVKANSDLTRRNAAWWERHEQAYWFPRIREWLNIINDQLSTRETSGFPSVLD